MLRGPVSGLQDGDISLAGSTCLDCRHLNAWWREATSGQTGLLPSLPEARATTRVCDRDDVEVVLPYPIHDLIREARNEQASMWHACLSKSADVRVFSNQFDRSNDGVVEIGAETLATRFIPAHGLGEFG